MPGLDGLRALAVIAVLLYHAGLAWLPGGFLGVEVFFVISGYLITALLITEWRLHGRIDLKNFWLRRARRLLPALYLLLFVALAYAVVFLPGEVAGMRGDAISALGYVTNWYLIFGNESYFEGIGRPSLLRHLWSLAVEEQFYLLWPPVLVLGAVFGARRYRLRRLTAVALGGALASTLLMAFLYTPEADPSRIYYGTDTRIAGLLVGATLAFVWRPTDRRASPGRHARLLRAGRPWVERLRRRYGWATPSLLDIFGLAALAGLVALGLRLGEFEPFLYRGGFLLVAGTTAVLIAVVAHPQTRLGRHVLGWAPLRWIGERSYGIYLWHWPVYMVTRPGLDVPLDGLSLLALRATVTVLLAHLSYRYVETPIRHGALGRAWRRLREARGAERHTLRLQWVAATTSVLTLCVALGIAVARAEAPDPPSFLATEAIHTAKKPGPAARDAEKGSTPESTPNNVGSSALREHLGESGATEREVGPGDGTDKSRQGAAAGAEDPGGKGAGGNDSSSAAPTGPVSAIGDSVMLGSAGPLQRRVEELSVVDAEVGMQVSEALGVLRSRRAAGQLGEVVVVHLGNNGTFTTRQFDQVMRVLSGAERVIFVNVRVPRTWETPNNEVIRAGVEEYPKAELIDWYAASAGRPDLFVSDGVHLQPPGQRLYAGLISTKIKGD